LPAWVKDEDKWKQAKKVVKDEYGKDENDGDDFWKLVTGVYKQMGGKTEGAFQGQNIFLYDSFLYEGNDLGFDDLPLGWDEDSVRQFAQSLTDKTGSEEGFWRACFARMKDHFGEEGAKKFCSALKDEYLGRTDWRGDPGG